VGRPDELKGQAIAAFVTLEAGQQPSEELRGALKQHVAKEIGAFARPDDIRFTDALPKTRSGKIMRRLLRDIAAGKETLGDTTTLEDYAELAEREIHAFGEGAAWVRCLPPTPEPRATAHIPAMLALIERLIGAGFAYPVADGSVYFRVRRFASYGKLSHRRLDDMETGEEIDAAKESPHDFALWKGAKPGEPSWPSPWGAGRPGWHIECGALARADEAAGGAPPAIALDGALADPVTGFLAEFCAAMDDDLNAARGLGLVFDRVRELNRLLDAGDRAAATDIRRELAVVGAA